MPAPAARRRSISDPLTLALMAPANETPADRERRLKIEIQAKKISDGIDEQLRAERAAAKKKKEIKVLLLGQSESGKSTTLKQFQLMYTPERFQAERQAWRSVIYLNLVRSVRRIMEALSTGFDPDTDSDVQASSPTDQTASPVYSSSFGRPGTAVSLNTEERLAQYAEIRLRLSPLIQLEDQLINMLSSADEDEATHLMGDYNLYPDGRKKEVFVRSGTPWKKALNKLGALGGKDDAGPEEADYTQDPKDPIHILRACKDDINSLWRDPAVRDILQRRRLRLEESSGFFLDEVDRITSSTYTPSDDDVLKARLKTIGVNEYAFLLDKGNEKGVEWKIYDVGGARNQRAAWAPYFDDMNAIIFLAPISAFDQTLAEDRTVNRVEDSLLLWRSVCTNKLLAHTSIVLFLNKCDLLQAKLDAGVKLSHHMTSYGERPNDYDSVSKYFRAKFAALHRSYTPNPEREVYVHLTSVTDTHKTKTIIVNVRDIILRGNLRESRLL